MSSWRSECNLVAFRIFGKNLCALYRTFYYRISIPCSDFSHGYKTTMRARKVAAIDLIWTLPASTRKPQTNKILPLIRIPGLSIQPKIQYCSPRYAARSIQVSSKPGYLYPCLYSPESKAILQYQFQNRCPTTAHLQEPKVKIIIIAIIRDRILLIAINRDRIPGPSALIQDP